MEKTIQVRLNNDEIAMLEEIRKYYEKAFMQKINTSTLLRFLIQKEHNWENGIELVIE